MAEENVATLVAKLIDDVSAPARAMGESLKTVTTSVGKLNTTFANFGKVAERNFEQAKTSLMGTAVAAGAFGAAIYSAMKPAMEFAGSLKTIEIQTGRSEEAMKDLRTQIFDISKSLDIGSQSIADNIKLLPASIRASTDSIKQVMTVTGQFARMFDEDIGAATKAVTPLMKNFGLTLSQLPRAYDEIAKSAKMANIPIETLQGMLPKLTTEWEKMGFKGNEGLAKGLAAITAVAERTGDAEAAAQAYIRVSEKMNDPKFQMGALAGRRLADIGTEAAARGLDPFVAKLNAIMSAVRARAGGDTERENSLLAMLFGGGRGMALFVRQFLDAKERITTATTEIYNSAGTVATGFEARMGEWGESWKRLGNTIDNVRKQVGATLGENLSGVADVMNSVAESFGKFAETYPEVVAGGAAIGGAILGLAAAVGVLNVAAWGLMANPVISMLAAGTAIGAGIYGLVKSGNFFNKGWNEGKGLFESAGANPYGALYGPGGESPWKNMSGAAWPELMAASSAERAARGQDTLAKPLQSIDKKMSDLITAIRGMLTGGSSPSFFGPGGMGGTGATPGGGTGVAPGRAHGQRTILSGRGGRGGGATPGAFSGRGYGGKSDAEVQNIIREEAKKAGVDPELLLGIYAGEGRAGYIGDRGTSFGPFQLHVGGGMGDEAEREGIRIRDPNTIREQAAFVARTLKRSPGRLTEFHGYHGNWKGSSGGSAGGGGSTGDYKSGYHFRLAGGAAGRGYDASIGNMQPEFRTRLAAMFQGYEQATGRRDEDVFSGWRSEADQAGIRRTARPGYAARGTSHHTLGDAADIHGDLDWFHAHAGEYGLQFPMWPPGKKSITEGWHVQGDPNTNVPVPHTEPEHQSMNMAPKMDDTDLDDGIKKMERLHHLAKTMPKIKLAHADDGIDRIHRNLNSRYMG